jgi:hypothetical protein
VLGSGRFGFGHLALWRKRGGYSGNTHYVMHVRIHNKGLMCTKAYTIKQFHFSVLLL